MHGLILAGGQGTRLAPISSGVNKHLLPVFDKPMIYYPITTLMLAGVKQITLVCNPNDVENFSKLLGNGHEFGVSLDYRVQAVSDGIVGALKAAKTNNDGESLAVILGDNFFFGSGVGQSLSEAFNMQGALCIVKTVSNPSAFGVCLLEDGLVVDIEEKPHSPKSNLAVAGLYFLDGSWSRRLDEVVPSARGELEITDLLAQFASEKALRARVVSRGTVWFDLGTVSDLFAASKFVEVIQRTSSTLVGSPHEASVIRGWKSAGDILELCRGRTGPYFELLEATIRSGSHPSPI